MWTFNLAGVGRALLGPIEEGFDAFMLDSGQSTFLWLVDEPLDPAGFGTVPPTLTDRDAARIGFRLARANVFIPASVERWWLLKTTSAIFLPPANRVRIVTWRTPKLPATR